jgi:hypothetical protein
VERLRQRFSDDKTVGVAYVYIEDFRSSPYCSATISSLLGSICRQILRFPLGDGLVRSYNEYQRLNIQGQASKSQILYALQHSIADYSRVIVVMDGIDALPLSFPLEDLFSELSRLSLQTFATSRPEPNIMEYFKTRNDILLKMGSNESDLVSFIKRRALNSTVLTRLMRADDTALNRISTAVFERCEGTYVFNPKLSGETLRTLRLTPHVGSYLPNYLLRLSHNHGRLPVKV